MHTAFSDPEQVAVTYTLGDRQWNASLADLGVTIDHDTTNAQTRKHARTRDRHASRIAGTGNRDNPAILHRDESVMRATLERIGDQIALAPRDAALELQDNAIVVVEGSEGRRLDIEAAVVASRTLIDAGEPGVIELATLPILPDVQAADLAAARDDAARLVSEPVVFRHGTRAFPVDVATLAAALVIERGRTASLDPARLEPRIDAIADAVTVPAQNVQAGWDGGLYVISHDVDGVEVDRESLTQAIVDLAESAERTAPLPVVPVKAAARADNIVELGIDAHLATGSSSFAGSPAARAKNVVVSARHISYKLIPPGGVFSFNRMLGPITPENGFVEGNIIDGDFVATDIGGGVCQVSTTVFRAAVHAGFPFEEWHPHSWRLAFYETDGSPPGFDSAIYQPNFEWEVEKDLRFANPLDSWLLLQVVVDGDTVAAHLYGRPNGWKVKLGQPQISEPKPVPEPVVRVNHDLGPGERIRVQDAQAGVTVRIRRTVTAVNGEVVADGDFVSDYRSVPEVWEIGPG